MNEWSRLHVDGKSRTAGICLAGSTSRPGLVSGTLTTARICLVAAVDRVSASVECRRSIAVVGHVVVSDVRVVAHVRGAIAHVSVIADVGVAGDLVDVGSVAGLHCQLQQAVRHYTH